MIYLKKNRKNKNLPVNILATSTASKFIELIRDIDYLEELTEEEQEKLKDLCHSAIETIGGKYKLIYFIRD